MVIIVIIKVKIIMKIVVKIRPPLKANCLFDNLEYVDIPIRRPGCLWVLKCVHFRRISTP